MLNKTLFLLIIFSLVFFIKIIAGTPYLGTVNFPDYQKNDVIPSGSGSISTNKDVPQSSGSSRTLVTVLSESPPIKTIRKIISPKRENGYFPDDVIEVLVIVTSLKKGDLKYIEILEKPGEKLNIQKCSYPIRTYSLNTIFDYQISDESILRKEDIINTEYIGRLLNNNTDKFYPNPHKDPNTYKLFNHLYSLLSPETQELLIIPNFLDVRDNITECLLNDLNQIINSNSSLDLNATLLTKYGIALDRKKVYSFNSLSSDYIKSKDHKLIKRRLIEHMFPGMIKNLSFYKEHEEFISSNFINIKEKNLAEGESIVFKYYLTPSDLGITDIQSLIKTEGFIHEESTPLIINKREAQFQIEYWSPSKELVKNQPSEFNYIVKYLGGDDDRKTFSIKLNPVNNSPNHKNYCNVRPDEIKLELMKGQTENFSVDVTYYEPGYKISPPMILIDGHITRAEADLSVFERKDMMAKQSYERLNLESQEKSNWISIALFILSFFSLLELLLIWREYEDAKKERIANTIVVENLTRIVKEKL